MQLVLKSYTIRPRRCDDAESLVKHANNRNVLLAPRDLDAPQGLSRAVTVHHAHFTMDLVVALRLAKDGIRVCLRSLFRVRAARKQQPDRNENYTRSRRHVAHLDLLDTQVNLSPGPLIPVPTTLANCPLSIARRQRNE